MKARMIFILSVCVLFSLTGCQPSVPVSTEDNSMTFGLEQMPGSINFFIDYNNVTIWVGQLLYESLCDLDMETWELNPRLAESWTISDDKMTYTFVLNKNAKWADGTPVTTDDVMFTYETIMDPKNLTSLFRSDFESNFNQVFPKDERTVVFKAKTKRWSSFLLAASFTVLPKKSYAGKDFNKEFNLMLPPGSGPYEIDKVEPDRFIQLKKRSDFWCRALPNKKSGIYNFDRLMIKFIAKEEIRLEALKKGDLDFFHVTRAKDWVELTKEKVPEQIKNNHILAKRVWNYLPQGFQGFHMNLRKELFKNLRVRQALAMLLNIDLINEKIMFNQYERLRSYFPDYFNKDNDLPLFNYDPVKARQLLAEAGWDKVGKDGILVNAKGQRFSFEFLYDSPSLERHITIFKEDCQKVGVQVNLVLTSAPNFRKKVFEDHDYDMTWQAWGRGGPWPTNEDSWKSDRADLANSNNTTGYKNPGLDKIIDQYLEEYDIQKRTALLKQIDMILANDVPTILLWGGPYVRMLYWNKYGMIPTVLKKHDDIYSEDSPYTNWWLDGQKFNSLKEARKNSTSLPAEPTEIYYDMRLAPQK